MKFYRYEAVQYTSYRTIKLIELTLYKETPKGYWIGYGEPEEGTIASEHIWVSKTAKKRFAYPTKEEAKVNFVKRNQRRLKILKAQIENCKYDLVNISL